MAERSNWDRCCAELEAVIGRKLTQAERAILSHGFTHGHRDGRESEARAWLAMQIAPSGTGGG